MDVALCCFDEKYISQELKDIRISSAFSEKILSDTTREYKIDYESIINKNNLIIGGRYTGKSILLEKILEKFVSIKNVTIITPEYIHTKYKRIMPHANIITTLDNNKFIQLINEYKENKKIYDRINDADILRSLFEKATLLNNHHTLITNEECEKLSIHDQHKITIIANRRSLYHVSLTDEEKFTLDNIFFRCQGLFIIEDSDDFFKKMMINQDSYDALQWLFTSSEFASITNIVSAHCDSCIPLFIKNKAHTIIFTTKLALNHYIINKYSKNIRDFIGSLSDIVFDKPYKKIVIYDNNTEYRALSFIEPFIL